MCASHTAVKGYIYLLTYIITSFIFAFVGPALRLQQKRYPFYLWITQSKSTKCNDFLTYSVCRTLRVILHRQTDRQTDGQRRLAKITKLSEVGNNSDNKGQSSVAKGDIARLIMSYAKEILSISSVIFARRHEFGLGVHLRRQFWPKVRS